MTTYLKITAVLLGLGLSCAPLLTSAQDNSPSGTCTTNCGYDWQAAKGVTSTSSYMESHRFQRHSVVTADGYIHIIVNTGSPTTISGSPNSGALEILTSPNNGQNWYPTYVFPGTVGSQSNLTVSTDDIRLVTTGIGQYLQVAYDVQGVQYASGLANAVMFTQLSYTAKNATPSATNTWGLMTGYPETVIETPITSTSITYQQPAFALDGPGNIWLTDYEIPNGSTNSGQIGVYEYLSNAKQPTWSATSYGASLPCIAGNGSGASPNVTCANSGDSTGVQHAARPVFVPYKAANSPVPANVGIIYQSGNCLFWVTINVNNAAPVSTAQELSSASNQATGTSGCNLPSAQSGYEDTAASISTNPTVGDQYLGFAVQYPSATNPTGTSVFALTYQAATATWSDGQLFAGPSSAPNTPVYVKTSLVQAPGDPTEAYVFINYGTNSPVEVLTSPLITCTPATSTTQCTFPNYSQLGVYYHSLANTVADPGQSFANPRLEAPEYVNSDKLSTVPLWEQYTFSMPTGSTVATQSLIYWSIVPN